MMNRVFIFLLLTYSFTSCKSEVKDPIQIIDLNEELSGGELTSFDTGENAFGHEAGSLDAAQSDAFVIGNSFFRSNWTTAPASASARDGLGPLLNASSCGGCHEKDGRAKPPQLETDPLGGLLFRLSAAGSNAFGGPNPDPNYGWQLNNKAIPNAKPEGNISIIYEQISGKYADGTSYFLRKPNYKFKSLAFGDFAIGHQFSPRIAQQLPGLGLLEAISEANILLNADENDINKDGISGKPNYVWDFKNNIKSLGRFGWKANQPNLYQQTAAAFSGDIGITSSLFPNENLIGKTQELFGKLINGGEPEISDKNMDAVVLYMQTLRVPARRNWKNEAVIKGKKLFTAINCNSCHLQSFQTSNHPLFVLQNQKIYPYSDLLLHDMGNDLADNRPDYQADGNEWRTPPLWGIGMIKTVNKHTNLMHDGRARNLEEAILWHGGESEKSKLAFKALSKTDRNLLIKFLESL